MRRKFTDPKTRLPGRKVPPSRAPRHPTPGPRQAGLLAPPRQHTSPGVESLDMFPLLFPVTAAQINRIEEKVDNLMAAVKIEQAALDQFATDIADSAALIAQELANLVASADNPLTDADVTSLQAAVDQLKGLEPPHAELQ